MADTPTALAPSAPPELPDAVTRRGITEAQWRTLANNLFPGAASSSVLMVWDYCAARGLDPMKKPCHIVPMEVKDAKSGEYGWRDVVMPGIYEYRITAHRTGQYHGHSEPEYGPLSEQFGVTAPEWCRMVIYRWNQKSGEKVPFPVQVFFGEVVATRKDKQSQKIAANARWTRAPRQMLAKCTEAAGLREAFPEEIGGEPTAEEMDGQRAFHVSAAPVIDTTIVTAFDRIPEPMRDNIERAFAELNLTAGQRVARTNEFLGGDGVDPEAGALKLLEWCKDEYAKQKTGQARRPKGNGNDKKKDDAPTVGAAAPVGHTSGTGNTDRVDPVAGSGGTVAPSENTPATSAPVATPAKEDDALF